MRRGFSRCLACRARTTTSRSAGAAPRIPRSLCHVPGEGDRSVRLVQRDPPRNLLLTHGPRRGRSVLRSSRHHGAGLPGRAGIGRGRVGAESEQPPEQVADRPDKERRSAPADGPDGGVVERGQLPSSMAAGGDQSLNRGTLAALASSCHAGWHVVIGDEPAGGANVVGVGGGPFGEQVDAFGVEGSRGRCGACRPGRVASSCRYRCGSQRRQRALPYNHVRCVTVLGPPPISDGAEHDLRSAAG